MKEIMERMKKEVIKRNAPVLKMRKILNSKPFWTLIAAVLSTRTKDTVVIPIVEKLMKNYSIKDIANMDIGKIMELIKPVGFYKEKAKYLKEIANYFIKHGPPKSYEELIKLPGVGRKVARIYQVYVLKEEEIPVDTHVMRITNRIFGKNFKKPEDVEEFLKKKFEKELWKDINWVFVGFGQTVCLPKNPKCEECPIRKWCKYGSLGKDTL